MHKTAINRGFLVLTVGLLLGMGLMQLFQGERDFSPMENRSLTTSASIPQEGFSLSRLIETLQNIITDQVPGRDAWIQLQAIADASFLRAERNGIVFGRESRLYEDTSTWQDGILRANVQAVDQMAGLIQAPVSLMLVPTSAQAYPGGLPAWIPAENQGALIESLYDGLTAATPIDVRTALSAPSESPLYYRTDHHWTAEGAARVTQVLLNHYGLASSSKAPERITVPDFYGSYYAHAPSPWIGPDTFSVDLYDNVQLLVEGKEMPGLLNTGQAAARDKYAAVLYGNHGRGTLINPGAPGGCLVVLQDSYANAVLPALAQHFSRIETVDLRYFSGDLMSFLQETEADQILCIYGLSTLVGDRSLLLQSALWPL